MFCKYVKNNLSALLDNELKGPKERFVKSHLVSCHECREKLEFLRCVSEAVAVPVKEKLPSGFTYNVMAQVKLAGVPANAPRFAQKPVFGLRLAAGVFGLMVVLAAGIAFYHPQRKLMLPEASFSQQTSAGPAVGSEAQYPDIIQFASFASQTRR